MKIIKLGEPRVIMSNPRSIHNYFGWPTTVRLKNGKIAVVASGNRLSHICPFGKTVISYSSDEGESYTNPAPVIDTVLDDRDGGIATFGDKGVIVTSFNNTTAFQRKILDMGECIPCKALSAYAGAYIDSVDDETEKRDLGVTFRISHDGGITFGPIYKSPITSPHGPTELSDGTLLWVGTVYDESAAVLRGENTIKAYKINTDDGSMDYVGEIENIVIEGDKPHSCEPHALQISDGRIIAHIRVQYIDDRKTGLFTVYQSESSDGGKTWTKPHALLGRMGGSPPHIFETKSGLLVSTYGYREKAPFGVKAMFSKDGGKTWDTDHYLYENYISSDLGYPSTVELCDGSFLTVFYAIPEKGGPAVIMQQKWKIEE